MPSQSRSHPHSPDNPERIAARRAQYAAILREHQEDASEQLVAAFLEQMEGKEYGEGPLLSAFAWFWNGWAASSGARAVASETQPSIPAGYKLVPQARIDALVAVRPWETANRLDGLAVMLIRDAIKSLAESAK